MFIKQLSVFVENKPGRLAIITRHLADAGINLYAVSMADTTDFGIVRLIVSNHKMARKVLKENNFTVLLTDVLGVALEHRPGYLADLLAGIAEEEISVEYMYAFTSRLEDCDAMVVFRLSDQERAREILQTKVGARIIPPELIETEPIV